MGRVSTLIRRQAIGRVSGWPAVWLAGAALFGIASTLALTQVGLRVPPAVAAGAGLLVAILRFAVARGRGQESTTLLAVAFLVGFACAPPRKDASAPMPPEAEGLALVAVETITDAGGFRGRVWAGNFRGRWERSATAPRVAGFFPFPAKGLYLVAGKCSADRLDESLWRWQVAACWGLATRESARMPWSGWAATRARWAARWREAMGTDAGSLAGWMLLNVTPPNADRWSAPFRQTGTMHVLSISGLHLSLLATWVDLTVRILLRRPAPWLTASVLALYAAFAGGPAAALRAAGMSLALSAGLRALRSGRLWNALALSTVTLCLASPSLCRGPALELSVTATSGVILGARFFEAVAARGQQRFPRLRALAEPFSLLGASLGAFLLTIPWCWLHFGAVYPRGILVNLFVVPMANLVLPCQLVSGLALVLGAEDGAPLALLGRAMGEALMSAVRLSAPWSARDVWSGSMGAADTVGLTCLFAATLLVAERWVRVSPKPRSRRARSDVRFPRVPVKRIAPIVLTVLAVAMSVAVFRIARGERRTSGARITFLDVGQGDAVLLQGPSVAWLFDLGPGKVAGRDLLAPALLRAGVRRLDRVFVSHGDLDHWAGLAGVLATGIPIDTLTLSAAATYPDSFWAALEGGAARPEPERVGAGWRRSFGREAGMAARMLHPIPGVPPTDDNDASLVLSLETGTGWRVLLVGDLGRPGEARLLAAERAAGDTGLAAGDARTILQAGHHGSRTSSSGAWLDRLQPTLGVASLARGNRFEFPHPEVLEAYGERGIPLFRVDRDGAVTLEFDGDALRLRRARAALADPGAPCYKPSMGPAETASR